eukprot:GHVR01031355.1.p1 GENE.GHVR01031355.1~~GHVR01031355.1.p1  ORF type:complete len:118 (+),score=12.40 GHVR01031355.1:233-586(+)
MVEQNQSARRSEWKSGRWCGGAVVHWDCGRKAEAGRQQSMASSRGSVLLGLIISRAGARRARGGGRLARSVTHHFVKALIGIDRPPRSPTRSQSQRHNDVETALPGFQAKKSREVSL